MDFERQTYAEGTQGYTITFDETESRIIKDAADEFIANEEVPEFNRAMMQDLQQLMPQEGPQVHRGNMFYRDIMLDQIFNALDLHKKTLLHETDALMDVRDTQDISAQLADCATRIACITEMQGIYQDEVIVEKLHHQIDTHNRGDKSL